MNHTKWFQSLFKLMRLKLVRSSDESSLKRITVTR